MATLSTWLCFVKGIRLKPLRAAPLPHRRSPFRYFKRSPEIILPPMMMYIRFPLSLRNVEGLFNGCGTDVCHECIRLWVDRFGTFFARMIRRRRPSSPKISSLLVKQRQLRFALTAPQAI